MKFSERYGYVSPRTAIQFESMDDALRNKLWNVLKIYYWDGVGRSPGAFGGGYYLSSERNRPYKIYCDRLWFSYLKEPLDTLPDEWEHIVKRLRGYFFDAEWYGVYDFLEFTASQFPHENDRERYKFRETCNKVLEQEKAAYRFVEDQIAPITEESELQAIEEATAEESLVRTHLQRALAMLSDRSKPDYRNSVKESISAVESLASEITGNSNGTLGQLLKEMERHMVLHSAMKGAFDKLYGYSSDEDGIRHALTEKDTVDFEDAKFMLVACSAFVNYVRGKME